MTRWWALLGFGVAACSSGIVHTLPPDSGVSVVDGGPSADSGQADAGADAGSTPDAGDAGPWVLSWSDEFNGANGSPPDPTYWTNEVGGGGWGNQEHEYYTAGAANAAVQNGSLVITARNDDAASYTCWYGTCQYTSARIITKGKFSQAYGRFEARIQIPAGQGLWPAFWLLGDNIDTVGWPTCGEVDIMENIGKEPSINHGSAHGPNGSGGDASMTASFMLSGGQALSAAYHLYALEWEPNVLRFYVDDQLYETDTPANLPTGATWVYDHPFYILLNVAVGGAWPGLPDNTTVFPQTMLVDYVRVYTHQ